MMTTGQKKQLLDYLGYEFDVRTSPNVVLNHVVSPDFWAYFVDIDDTFYERGFEGRQLSELIDIAWAHHEQNERAMLIEAMAKAAIRYIDICDNPQWLEIYEAWFNNE